MMQRAGVTKLSCCLVAIVLAITACDSNLDVLNQNAPDRERAVSDPKDLEALISGSFGRIHFSLNNEPQTVNLLPTIASEMTGVSNAGAAWGQGVEPRVPLENDPNAAIGSAPLGPRILWRQLLEAASNVHDGLRSLEALGEGIREGGQDVTPRAEAFAKFVQGWSWSYLGMLYDRVVLIPESVPFSSNPIQQARDNLVPREQAIAAGIASFQEAISIAQAGNVTFPAATLDWFGLPQAMSTAEFVQLTNTMIARVMVLQARTPAERAQVDWNAVLLRTNAGLKDTDLRVQLSPGGRSSLWLARLQDNSAGSDVAQRWDYRVIGMADISGAYQTWINSPPEQRDRFNIVTPDRRITGETPTSPGAYTRWLSGNNGFPQERGLYRRSAYQWQRLAHQGMLPNNGLQVLASVDETNLLKAEAHLRLGQFQQAADLINITRTRAHTLPNGQTYAGLPPVTANGVPAGAQCVPRNDQGQCGDLMVALRYERMLELAGYDLARGYMDSRGFGMLPDLSYVQLPVPGDEMLVQGQQFYTFGGPPDTEWAAVYAPAQLQ